MKWFRLFALIMVLAGCSYLKDHPPPQPEEYLILTRIDTTLIADSTLQMPASVAKAYRNHGNQFLFSDTAGLTPQGDTLLFFIRRSVFYGLIPEDYHTREIDLLYTRPRTNERKMQLDIWLTDGFFSLRSHLKNGRLDPKTLQRIDLSEKIDTNTLLLFPGHGKSVPILKSLEFQEPVEPQYHLLKDSLATFLSTSSKDSVVLRKINTLVVNMERWRLTKKFPGRYLGVNIPSFLMKVVEGDTTVFESNIIVGKPETPTPVLESIIPSFVIYPYWHVPRSISTKEILPLIQADTTYLAKHNYDVLDRSGKVVTVRTIDWKSLHETNFPYILRQREGNENTLGVIKFYFSNPYGVYLHDTNGRRLFKKEKRAMSHGCVRVEKAKQLARYLVKDDSIYVTPEDLDQYLMLQQRLKLEIVKPLPLLIHYFTCEWKNERLLFFKDIYGKDKLMLENLTRKKGRGIDGMIANSNE